MKLYAVLTLILFLTMLFVPLFSLLGRTQSVNAPVISAAVSENEPESQAETQIPESTEVRTEEKTTAEKVKTNGDIAVLRASSGNVENIDLTDFVVGCVASGMRTS